MTVRNAEEVAKSYQETMGPNLGSMFCALYFDVAHLHEKWGQYKELFATSEDRVQMLNRAAPGLFGSLQRTLWTDIILHVARINDKPSTAGRANLTLRSLVQAVEEPGFRSELTSLADRARELARFCTDWRNRKLAHKDLDLAIQKAAKPLEAASRAKVQDALGSIADLMNSINLHFCDSEIIFLEEWGAQNAQNVLHVLSDGLHLEEIRTSYHKAGKLVPEFLRSRGTGVDCSP